MPGPKTIRYVPSRVVVVLAASAPAWEKTRVTFAAGASQGLPAWQTGVVGPRMTTPWSPVAVPASAHTAAAAAADTTRVQAIFRTPRS